MFDIPGILTPHLSDDILKKRIRAVKSHIQRSRKLTLIIIQHRGEVNGALRKTTKHT